MSAKISTERPLTDPDIVLDIVSLLHVSRILIAENFGGIVRFIVPSLVVMMIENNILSIFEQIIPYFRLERQVDGVVVEHELSSILCQDLDQSADSFVEVFEHWQVRIFPGFIDGLKRAKSVVVAPFLEEFDANLDGSLNVFGVHFIILLCRNVPVSEPV